MDVYSLRATGNEVYSYSQMYAVGGDYEYAYLTLRQSDYYLAVVHSDPPTPTQIGTTLTATAAPGYTAKATRSSTVSAIGFGTYSTTTSFSAYDACSDRYFPPFDNGFPGTQTASTVVTPPAITGNSYLWAKNYGSAFPNSSLLQASTGGAPETPQWSFSTSNITPSCTVCGAVEISVAPGIEPSCSPVAVVSYNVGGLTSNLVPVLVESLVQTAGTSPATGMQVDNESASSVPGSSPQYSGYRSLWYWNVASNCGSSAEGANMKEEFPNGFTQVYTPQSGWGVPVADQWTVSGGGWFDTIGERCVKSSPKPLIAQPSLPSPGYWSCSPVAQAPGIPLSQQLMYYGLQYVYAGTLPSKIA